MTDSGPRQPNILCSPLRHVRTVVGEPAVWRCLGQSARTCGAPHQRRPDRVFSGKITSGAFSDRADHQRRVQRSGEADEGGQGRVGSLPLGLRHAGLCDAGALGERSLRLVAARAPDLLADRGAGHGREDARGVGGWARGRLASGAAASMLLHAGCAAATGPVRHGAAAIATRLSGDGRTRDATWPRQCDRGRTAALQRDARHAPRDTFDGPDRAPDERAEPA